MVASARSPPWNFIQKRKGGRFSTLSAFGCIFIYIFRCRVRGSNERPNSLHSMKDCAGRPAGWVELYILSYRAIRLFEVRLDEKDV